MSVPLGVYTRYDRLGASSRLRYYGYRAAFEAAGFAPEFHPFFSDAYLTRLYAGRGKSRLLAAAALVRRFAASTRLPEKLLIEYELLPELPYGIEARFLRGRRYVLNFDDDVWIKYEGRGRLADKYDRLVAGACGVVCANDLLLEKVLDGGMSMTDYSKARGIDVSTVFEAKRDVQKKAKIFFKETPKN